jgi:hypothetical protein
VPPLLDGAVGEADAIANDRRFATTIYRMAVTEGPDGLGRLRRPNLITLAARRLAKVEIRGGVHRRRLSFRDEPGSAETGSTD